MVRTTTEDSEAEAGFTLIELLVVIIIIGILAAIAIPTFLSQRQKAFHSAARSDMKQLANLMESGFTDTQVHNTTGLADYKRSPGVRYAYKISSNGERFCVTTYNAKALTPAPAVADAEVSGVFVYDSAEGGDAATSCAAGNDGVWTGWT